MTPSDRKSKIIWLQTTDSTNTEIKRRIDSLDNLSVIATVEQSEGRGQGDHKWHSLPGQNLTFSLLLRFPTTGQGRIRTSEILLITCITTLGIRDYLGSRGVESRIKWPNDIWVGDKKICGILIENTLDHDCVAHSIVGIGLDINQTVWPDELPNPISLKQLTGISYDLETELEELAACIEKRCALLASEERRKSLEEEFRRNCFTLNAERR